MAGHPADHPGPLEPTGPVESAPRPEPAITVAFALVKRDRPELVVQKLIELGVDRISPFRAVRSCDGRMPAPPSLEHPCVLVGPEGGWAHEERTAVTAAGAPFVAVGAHVLRAETAAVTIGASRGFGPVCSVTSPHPEPHTHAGWLNLTTHRA